MATAERMYGLSSLCTVCVGGACVDSNTLTLQSSCLSSYNQAEVSMPERIGLSYSRLIRHTRPIANPASVLQSAAIPHLFQASSSVRVQLQAPRSFRLWTKVEAEIYRLMSTFSLYITSIRRSRKASFYCKTGSSTSTSKSNHGSSLQSFLMK